MEFESFLARNAPLSKPATLPLISVTSQACGEEGLTVDLLYMDDESVGTQQTEKIVAELQKEGCAALPEPARAAIARLIIILFPFRHACRIIVRRKGEGRGLSSAVLKGFDNAK